MPRPIPEYGIPLPPETVDPELPMYPIYGVTPSNEYIPLKTLGDGTLVTSATFSGSISIGALGVADKSSFTYGGSLEQPVGGVFNDSAATLSSGTTGALRLTSARGLHTNLRDSNGNELLGQSVAAASLPVVIASDQSAIPVSISGPISVTILNASLPVTQSGTWNLNNITGTISLPTGAATSVNQTTQQVALNAIETNTANIPPLGQALAAGSVPVVLTAAQLSTLTPLSTVTVIQPSGANLHVDVDNFPATQPVSGTVAVSNFPASQVVSQTTGTNLHTVVDNFPAIQPVSGTVTANAGTGTFNENLTEVGGSPIALGQAVSADSLPVVIASDQAPIPVVGTITTSPDVNVHDGSGNAIGSTSGSLDVDVTNTVAVSGTVTANAGTGTFAISAVSLPLPTGAATSALQTTGNTTLATIAANTSQLAGTQPVSIASNVTVVQPTGTNLHTVVDNFPATQPISGSVSVNNFPAVQPISGTVAVSNFPGTVAVTSLPSIPAGTNTIGTVLANVQDGTGNPIASTTGALNVYVANPSSLDTVNQGDPNTLANAWPVELSDGTNLLGTPANPLRVDPTGTTTQPVSVTNFPAIQPVSGTVTANQGTSPWVVSLASTTITGTVAVTQSGVWSVGRTWDLASGTDSVSAVQSGTWNLNNISGTISLPTGAATSAKQPALGTAGSASSDVITVQGIAGMTPLLVNGSGFTQPVSGTVTANQGTSPWVVSLSSTTITGTVAVTQSTSPWVVSGTVTANIGTTGGLALDTTVAALEVAQGSTTSGQHGILELGAVTTASPSYTTGQTSPLSLTLAGALRVDGSAVTQPISGTVAVSNFPATQNVDVVNTVPVSQSGTWNLNNITGTISLPTGAATSANQSTEIASLSAIQSSVANIPPLGQALAAASVPVVLTAVQLATLTPLSTVTVIQPSGTNLHTVVDSGTVAVSNFPGGTSTSVITSVAASTSSTVLLAANASRRLATIYNDSTSQMFIAFGSAASASNFTVRLQSTDYYEFPLPVYLGSVSAIWTTATGNARITEFS